MSALPDLRRKELTRLFLHRGTSSAIGVANDVEDFLIQHGKKNAVAAGKILQLTWEEKHQCHIRTVACIDHERWEVSAFYREGRRQRDRDRKRIQRMPEAQALIDAENARLAAIEAKKAERREKDTARRRAAGVRPREEYEVPAWQRAGASSKAAYYRALDKANGVKVQQSRGKKKTKTASPLPNVPIGDT
jgi:hypothetical protein